MEEYLEDLLARVGPLPDAPETAPDVVVVNNSDPSEASVVINIEQLVVNLGS